jgi:hypothetical protein
VHHSGSAPSEITVQDLPVEAQLGTAATSTENEATGYSKYVPYEGSWSNAFGEALADALTKLSPRASYPDELIRVSVSDSGVMLGGIAGFRHMYVSVRRNRGRNE